MKHLKTLSTERLLLEPVIAAHADEAWPLQNDDRMWTYFPELRPRSLEHLRTIYERREHGSPDPSTLWLNYVCRERSSQQLIGEVQATVDVDDESAFVAYAIFPAFQRKGYAREATTALIDFVRSTHGVQDFFAEMDTRNEPSYRLAESMGFIRVETKSGVHHADFTSDEYLYALTFDRD